MGLLGLRSFPYLTRRNYLYEFRHILGWSVLVGLIEGGQFPAILIANTFHGGATAIAIANATPFAAFSFSLMWGMLCAGRSKVMLMSGFCACAALCVGLSGFALPTPGGMVWFIALIALAQISLSGVVTVRSALWKSNYPQACRGRMTAGLQATRFLIAVLVTLVAASMCDANPLAYRFILPVGALFGLVSLWPLKRIHVRGERSSLKSKPHGDVESGGTSQKASLDSTTALSLARTARQVTRILRGDKLFARYCVAQFLIGIANLMTIPIVVLVITRNLSVSSTSVFWVSTALIAALPTLVRLGSLARWGRLFDRLGVIRYRVINVTNWILSLGLGMAATMVVMTHPAPRPAVFLIAISLFVLRGIANGLAQAGGTLAWNLGHLDFAPPEDAEIYMGIHVSLAGLRGLIAPFAGVWLWNSIGWPVWLISLALASASLLIFYSMRNENPRNRQNSPSKQADR